MVDLEDIVRVGKAIANPTRIRILAALAERDLCVCEIVDLVDAGQPAVSRHLRILRDAGFVGGVRAGRRVNYRLRHPARSPFAESVLEGLRGVLPREPRFRRPVRDAPRVDRRRLRPPAGT